MTHGDGGGMLKRTLDADSGRRTASRHPKRIFCKDVSTCWNLRNFKEDKHCKKTPNGVLLSCPSRGARLEAAPPRKADGERTGGAERRAEWRCRLLQVLRKLAKWLLDFRGRREEYVADFCRYMRNQEET